MFEVLDQMTAFVVHWAFTIKVVSAVFAYMLMMPFVAGFIKGCEIPLDDEYIAMGVVFWPLAIFIWITISLGVKGIDLFMWIHERGIAYWPFKKAFYAGEAISEWLYRKPQFGPDRIWGWDDSLQKWTWIVKPPEIPPEKPEPKPHCMKICYDATTREASTCDCEQCQQVGSETARQLARAEARYQQCVACEYEMPTTTTCDPHQDSNIVDPQYVNQDRPIRLRERRLVPQSGNETAEHARRALEAAAECRRRMTKEEFEDMGTPPDMRSHIS